MLVFMDLVTAFATGIALSALRVGVPASAGILRRRLPAHGELAQEARQLGVLADRCQRGRETRTASRSLGGASNSPVIRPYQASHC